MPDCIFCKIIAKEIPSEIVLENQEILVFKDIRPKARVHVLIVPKVHIVGVGTIEPDDQAILGKLILASKEAAGKLGILEAGFKLLINCGRAGGQEVDHLHIHLLSNHTSEI